MPLENKNAVIYATGGAQIGGVPRGQGISKLEAANVAVLMASDGSSAITGAVANVTSSEIVD